MGRPMTPSPMNPTVPALMRATIARTPRAAPPYRFFAAFAPARRVRFAAGRRVRAADVFAACFPRGAAFATRFRAAFAALATGRFEALLAAARFGVAVAARFGVAEAGRFAVAGWRCADRAVRFAVEARDGFFAALAGAGADWRCSPLPRSSPTAGSGCDVASPSGWVIHGGNAF